MSTWLLYDIALRERAVAADGAGEGVYEVAAVFRIG
jgi:hypothetical protein